MLVTGSLTQYRRGGSAALVKVRVPGAPTQTVAAYNAHAREVKSMLYDRGGGEGPSVARSRGRVLS